MSSTGNKVIQSDIMRYKTNKFSSNFTLLGIAFGCLYFLVLYGQYTKAYETENGSLYYNVQIGLSVIYNLVFLLGTFFLSIQVKNYVKSSSYALFVFAVLQVARIFWFPLRGYSVIYNNSHLVSTGSFVTMVLCLALSAACLIAAGVMGIIRNKQYYDHINKVNSGEIDMNAVLKQADAEEEQAAIAAKGE